MEIQPKFKCDVLLHHIVLAVRTRLGCDEETLKFDLDVDRGSLIVQLKYVGLIRLASEEVNISNIVQEILALTLKNCSGISQSFFYIKLQLTGSSLSEVSSYGF